MFVETQSGLFVNVNLVKNFRIKHEKTMKNGGLVDEYQVIAEYSPDPEAIEELLCGCYSTHDRARMAVIRAVRGLEFNDFPTDAQAAILTGETSRL